MYPYTIFSPRVITDGLATGLFRKPSEEELRRWPEAVAMWGAHPLIESTPIQIDSMEFSADPFRVTGLGGEE